MPSDLALLPPDLAVRSLSADEIVLPPADVAPALAAVRARGHRVLGWEGWLRHPDGRVGHSARHQGTVDLSALPPDAAAAVCAETAARAAAEAAAEPEAGELYVCLAVAAV
jgi:hypothetical protein